MKEFRKIKSLKFLYEVNNAGIVRNVKSKKILTPRDNGYGYLQITCTIKGKQIYPKIHRLVAECWCKIPDGYNIEDLTVNHKDHNRTNNNYKNLEWILLSDNIKEAFKYGSYKGLKNRAKNIIGIKNKTEYKFNSSIEAAEFIAKELNQTNINTIARNIRSGGYKYGYVWKKNPKAAETISKESKPIIDT